MVREVRLHKLESLVKQRVATLLSLELSDPRAGFITVTRVKLDREIQFCTIYYSVLGGEAEQSRTRHLLQHARGHIRNEIAKVLTTRTVPEVRFEFDQSVTEGIRLERIIDEAAAEARRLEEKAAGEGPPAAGEEPPPAEA